MIINTDSNNKKPITFRIVDSAMGVGKTQSLMEHIRFSESCHPAGVMNERYIIFVPTLSERDDRFRKRLGVKTPEDRPYSQSIRDMILNGDNIITTHALWSFFNDDTIKAFKQSKYSYAAYFDEVPGLFRDVVGAGRPHAQIAAGVSAAGAGGERVNCRKMFFVNHHYYN